LKLLIQPGAGIAPLIKAIKKARKSVEIVIFRFDQGEIEQALVDAVERGVFVHALIAFTNRGGEKRLRDLETEFLAKGITVARTSGDLVRYHGKMMLIDRKELYVLAFNFTHIDVGRSRSFGVSTRNPKLVQEATRLFEADTKRQTFTSNYPKLVVSPVNARKQLSEFLKGAKRELLIYDPKLTDKSFLRLLRERIDSGVKVKIIGERPVPKLPTRKLHDMRLHTRTIVRDGADAFLGSQSLRALELDSRREIGVLFREEKIVQELRKIFDKDWDNAERLKSKDRPVKLPVGKAAKKVAQVVSKQLPIDPIAKHVKKAIKKNGSKLGRKEVEKTMRAAVKKSVRHVVEKAAREAVVDVLEQVS
jgi:phosphatidylserine/phosphatidylglycerophosphate/cardiolipin synthase-like enzyme